MLWFNTFAPPCGIIRYMSYTMNPNMPRLRMQTAKLVIEKGWSTRQAARYTGFDHSTVVRWTAKARGLSSLNIATESSRPKNSPLSLSNEIVNAILEHRKK